MIKDKQLIFSQTQINKPLSKKHLITSLLKYFNGNSLKTQELSNFILNSRNKIIKEQIKIKNNTPKSKNNST